MIIDRQSPIPQYFQLQTWLIEQIEEGIFKPDDKIPTEEEIAQLTGLARATIRQAIQNLVNMGYLSRKRRLGTFVLERSVDANKPSVVGVLVHDIRSGYGPEFLRGLGDEAERNNLSVILCNTDDLFSRADFHTTQLLNLGIAGLIFMPTAASTEKNLLIVDKFVKRNIPVVLADREITDQTLDIVTTDNFRGAYELTYFLIKKGHRKIAITLSLLFSSERERFSGYKAALAENNIPLDSGILFTLKERFIESQFVQYAKIILTEKSKYTAIFAGNDRIAYLIYRMAREMGIRIPQEISLVGYDDLLCSSSYPVALTTIHQPIYEMGQECMRLLLKRIKGTKGEPQKIELSSYLVERESVLTLTNN